MLGAIKQPLVPVYFLEKYAAFKLTIVSFYWCNEATRLLKGFSRKNDGNQSLGLLFYYLTSMWERIKLYGLLFFSY